MEGSHAKLQKGHVKVALMDWNTQLRDIVMCVLGLSGDDGTAVGEI